MAPLAPDAFVSKEYDFLIIGGGTAGLVLSARSGFLLKDLYLCS